MEDPLKNDNLERFLQRVLGSYEESPPEKVWENIKDGLAADMRKRRTNRGAFWRTSGVVAGFLLLLALLAVQRARYRSEIARLESELTCCRQVDNFVAVAAPARNICPPEKMAARTKRPPTPANRQLTPVEFLSVAPVASPEAAAMLETNLIQLFPLHLRPGRQALPVTEQALPARTPVALPPAKKWAISRYSGLAYTYFTRNLSEFDQFWRRGVAHYLDTEKIVKTQTFLTGVSLEYRAGKRWSFETGAQYRQYTSRVKHFPDLRYGDRLELGAWAHRYSHNSSNTKRYTYYSDHTSGSIYVSLNVESTVPEAEITNQEALDVELTLEEQLDMLSIPLLAGYTIGNGSFTGHLQAGLLANIGMDYDVFVSEIHFKNPKFQMNEGDKVYLFHSAIHPVSFDFLLGAGVSWRMAPSWRLSFSPFLIGSLTKKFDGPFTDPNDYSIGARAGISHLF